MSLESLVRSGRRAFENKLMIDACTIQRQTGETVGAGGVITPTYSTVYTGKCRLKVETETGQAADIGEAYVIITRRVLQVPMTATGLREGDRVTITASVLDPELVGNTYAVRDVPEGSTLTRRDVTVVEVNS